MFRLTPARPLAATAAGSEFGAGLMLVTGFLQPLGCALGCSTMLTAIWSACRPTGSSCATAGSSTRSSSPRARSSSPPRAPGRSRSRPRPRPRASRSPRRGPLPRGRGRRLGRRVPGQPYRVGRSAPLTERPGLLPFIARESSLGSSPGPRQERKLGGRFFPSPSCRSAQLVPRTEARRAGCVRHPGRGLTASMTGRRPLGNGGSLSCRAAPARPRRPGTRSPSA